MNKYELMLLCASSEKETKELAEENFKKISAFLTTNDVADFKETSLGEKTLAYEIQKNTKAFFTVMNFSLPVEKAKELTKFLNLQEGIIRYLLTRL
jgi:ribosomal protein S6